MEYDVISFAKEELEKYLKLTNVKADIKVGLFEDFNDYIEVEDPYHDDAFIIKVEKVIGFMVLWRKAK